MITPMDIHNKTFSGQLRGYSKDEVNAFLEELASDYEKIYREHRAMEEELDIIRTKLRNYEKETADNVKKNAHKEAALSIQEAQSEAQKIVSDAEAARRKMNADLLKAEGDMNLYIEKLLSNFKSALALIEAAKAARAPQAVQAQQPVASEPSEPTAEAEPSSSEDAAAPAVEAPAAAPAPAGGNLFDEAAKTVAPKEEN